MGASCSMQIERQPKEVAGGKHGTIVVYGATWCHWSQRLSREWSSAGVPHRTVWCDLDAAACPAPTSFPLIELPDGRHVVGYRPVAWVQTELASFVRPRGKP